MISFSLRLLTNYGREAVFRTDVGIIFSLVKGGSHEAEMDKGTYNYNDVSIYYGWESYNQSKVFLNFDKLFNELNIDTNFPLSIIINFNLDKSNYSEELFYIVNFSEKKKFASAYIYKHFRGF